MSRTQCGVAAPCAHCLGLPGCSRDTWSVPLPLLPVGNQLGQGEHGFLHFLALLRQIGHSPGLRSHTTLIVWLKTHLEPFVTHLRANQGGRP